MADPYDELLVELECPVCTHYMAPPIRQCETGHSICETCRTKLPRCPLCQKQFTDSKNLSLEALACKLRYPCINRSSGCAARLSLFERQQHELNCTYKGIKCAMERCPWIGRLEDVLDHWNSKKAKSKIYQASNVCHTKIKVESYYTNLTQIDNELFWFKCKLEKGKIFWALQYLGPKDEAKDYYYEIEIFKPGFTLPKIVFTDYCQESDIENNELFKDGACISSNVDCITRFVSDDQLLIYYLRVHEIEGDESAAGDKQEAGKSKRTRFKKKFNKQRDHSKGSARCDHEKHQQKKFDKPKKEKSTHHN